MNIHVVRDEEEFLLLREEWNMIAERMEEATPFQTWEWNYHFWRCIERNFELNILAVYKGEKLVGVAPMINKDGALVFIGSDYSDYGSFIVERNTYRVISKMLKTLIEQGWSRIELRELSSRNPQTHALRRIFQNEKSAFFQQLKRTVSIPIRNYVDWEDYYKGLTSSFKKKNLNSRLKKEHEFMILDQFDSKAGEMIADIYDSRQEQRMGNSNLKLLLPFMESLHQSGLLMVTFINIGGVPKAFGLILDYKEKKYVWVTAFSPEFSGIGHLLHYYLMLTAIDKKNSEVDFMRGDYDYKLQLNGELHTNYQLILFKSVFQKYLFVIKYQIRLSLRNFVYRHKNIRKLYTKLSKYISYK
ncbi:GNAT family N-acetyltransferase [Bacillus sp. SG-1]|uniref:GNAT family N-acetyltransferase n=1 Tax=Bacillus sp. SG-1 TaxID=161544 RepID=UPI0018DC93EE|nr:GNAT family N-acetyltransferase [Bacillus sp. SG-1]